MPSRLVVCAACTRHVRVASSACPFCGAGVPPDLVARPPRVFAGPLTRAALTFGGVALSVAALSACDDAPSAPALISSYGTFVGSLSDYDAGAQDGPAQDAAAARDDAGAADHDGGATDAGIDAFGASDAAPKDGGPGETGTAG
jgi:hypothetical protein